jgi:O-methyltransferase involved in polyketide biosynthesis
MSLERDERIGPTAHYNAYVWHRLGLPYADLFVTRRGARLFWTFRLTVEWLAAVSDRIPSMPEYLAIRHLSFEHMLVALQPDRIVEIGAGLSRRGVTWAADRAIRYTEVDLPHMIAAKRKQIERAPPPVRACLDEKLSLVSRNILDAGFSDWLASELAGACRPVVLAEGVLGYFDWAERADIAASIRRGLAAAGGGSFLCDFRTQEDGRETAAAVKVLRAGIRLVTRGRGARGDFATRDDVRAFFQAAGFASSEPFDHVLLPPRLARLPSPARVWHALAASERPA